MKRILSILMTVTLVFGTLILPASATEQTSEQFMQKAETLISLKIFTDQSMDSLKPFSKVKKYQLVNYIYAMYNECNSLSGLNSIAAEFVEGIGVIDSAADLKASENLTFDAALKMIVEALGYGRMAQIEGGYPVGYRKIASELEILDGVGTSEGELLQLKDVTTMLYNAIDCPIMIIESYGSEVKYSSSGNKKILEHYRHIYKTEGIVTGNYYTSLWSIGEVYRDQVYIDSELYSLGKTNADKLVGYPVTAYYYSDDSSDKELVYTGKKTTKYKEMIIDAENIVEIDDKLTKLTYEENNRRKYVRLENVHVIYNGQYFGDVTAEDLMIEKGSLTLLDNANSGKYNVIFVDAVETMVVDSVDFPNKTINNKYHYDGAVEVLDVDTEEKDGELNITSNGRELDISEIREWDVLSVRRSKGESRQIINIEVCTEPVTGEVLSVSYSDKVVQIDDTEYNIAQSLIKAYEYLDVSGNNFSYANIEAGKEYIFYLTVEGEIAAAKVHSAAGIEIGYARKLSYDSGEEIGFVRLLNDENDWNTYQFSDKVMYNGRKKTPGELYNAEMAKGNGNFEQGLVQYKLDEDGKISFIETPVFDDGDTQSLRWRQKNISGELRYSDNSSSSKYFFDSTTTFWIIPDESNRGEEALYTITKNRTYLDKDNNYTFTAYNLDEWNFTDTVTVIYDTTVNKPTGNFFVVSEVIREVSGGEIQQSIVGSYKEYDMIKLTAEEDGLFDNIKPGDILVVNPNKNGIITRINGFIEQYKIDDGEVFYNTDNLYTEHARMSGYIVKTDVDKKRMKVDNGIEVITRRWLDNPYIVIFNKSSKMIERVSLDKLAPGDYIVYREFWGTITDIVAIRD